MKILFLHGWNSIPGCVKPTYLKDHGHEVINPALPHEHFAEAVKIAQAEFDKQRPQIVVGSSRGGAVAMNIDCGEAKLVLLCQGGEGRDGDPAQPGRRYCSLRRFRRIGDEQWCDLDRGRKRSPAGGPGAAGGDVAGVWEVKRISREP